MGVSYNYGNEEGINKSLRNTGLDDVYGLHYYSTVCSVDTPIVNCFLFCNYSFETNSAGMWFLSSFVMKFAQSMQYNFALQYCHFHWITYKKYKQPFQFRLLSASLTYKTFYRAKVIKMNHKQSEGKNINRKQINRRIAGNV